MSNELVVRLQYWDKELNVGNESLLKVELNLEFVNKKYYNKEKMTTFEKALMILVIEDEKELIEFMKGDIILESVGNDIISYSRAKEIVTAYENQMIEENYRNNRAREEGYDKGLEEGRDEGIKERNAEMANSMLIDDIPLEIISKYTGLSIEDLVELKKGNE